MRLRGISEEGVRRIARSFTAKPQKKVREYTPEEYSKTEEYELTGYNPYKPALIGYDFERLQVILDDALFHIGGDIPEFFANRREKILDEIEALEETLKREGGYYDKNFRSEEEWVDWLQSKGDETSESAVYSDSVILKDISEVSEKIFELDLLLQRFEEEGGWEQLEGRT